MYIDARISRSMPNGYNREESTHSLRSATLPRLGASVFILPFSHNDCTRRKKLASRLIGSDIGDETPDTGLPVPSIDHSAPELDFPSSIIFVGRRADVKSSRATRNGIRGKWVQEVIPGVFGEYAVKGMPRGQTVGWGCDYDVDVNGAVLLQREFVAG
jgi:hypothetical protein